MPQRSRGCQSRCLPRTIRSALCRSRGHDLLSGRDINQAPASPAPLNPRPVPQFGDIIALESRSRSLYNSMQVKFQQRPMAGLSVLAAYTLGNSTDDGSVFFSSAGDPNFPQDSNDPAAEHGRSNFDARHRFSTSFFYELPFGRGRTRAGGSDWWAGLVSGWQVAGVLTLQSGRPFTVALLPEIDNSNTGRAALGFGANDRPNVVGDPSVSAPSSAQWFDPGAFAFPAFGRFGDAGRNILDGPGYQSLSLALIRRIPLSDDVDLRFRLEAFNAFNHVNLDLPDAFLGSPTFGRILSAGEARRLQIGVKVVF